MASSALMRIKAKESKLLEKAQASKARMVARIKEQSGTIVNAGCTIAGGALAGYIDRNYQSKRVFGVDYPLAGGLILTVAGISGWGGSKSELLTSLGCGMLAHEAGNRVLTGWDEGTGK